MFFSKEILGGRSALGTVWIAAHMEKKLKKKQIESTDISSSVDNILKLDIPLFLRVSAVLMLGVSRVHAKKVHYLLTDSNEVWVSLQKSRLTGARWEEEETDLSLARAEGEVEGEQTPEGSAAGGRDGDVNGHGSHQAEIRRARLLLPVLDFKEVDLLLQEPERTAAPSRGPRGGRLLGAALQLEEEADIMAGSFTSQITPEECFTLPQGEFLFMELLEDEERFLLEEAEKENRNTTEGNKGTTVSETETNCTKETPENGDCPSDAPNDQLLGGTRTVMDQTLEQQQDPNSCASPVRENHSLLRQEGREDEQSHPSDFNAILSSPPGCPFTSPMAPEGTPLHGEGIGHRDSPHLERRRLVFGEEGEGSELDGSASRGTEEVRGQVEEGGIAGATAGSKENDSKHDEDPDMMTPQQVSEQDPRETSGLHTPVTCPGANPSVDSCKSPGSAGRSHSMSLRVRRQLDTTKVPWYMSSPGTPQQGAKLPEDLTPPPGSRPGASSTPQRGEAGPGYESQERGGGTPRESRGRSQEHGHSAATPSSHKKRRLSTSNRITLPFEEVRDMQQAVLETVCVPELSRRAEREMCARADTQAPHRQLQVLMRELAGGQFGAEGRCGVGGQQPTGLRGEGGGGHNNINISNSAHSNSCFLPASSRDSATCQAFRAVFSLGVDVPSEASGSIPELVSSKFDLPSDSSCPEDSVHAQNTAGCDVPPASPSSRTAAEYERSQGISSMEPEESQCGVLHGEPDSDLGFNGGEPLSDTGPPSSCDPSHSTFPHESHHDRATSVETAVEATTPLGKRPASEVDNEGKEGKEEEAKVDEEEEEDVFRARRRGGQPSKVSTLCAALRLGDGVEQPGVSSLTPPGVSSPDDGRAKGAPLGEVTSQRTKYVAQFLKNQFEQVGCVGSSKTARRCGEGGDVAVDREPTLKSGELLEGCGRSEAARFFFELLLLNNRGRVRLDQPEAYQDIVIRRALSDATMA